MSTKILFGVLLSAALAGCATSAPQVRALSEQPPPVPPVRHVENVPFVEQAAGHCGPATLAMAMRWAGRPVDIEALVPEVYTPGREGSLQMDIVAAARRHGLIAVPISGFPALLKEVAAGHPVIVFENQALSWAPRWHYALVLGYDLRNREIVRHSGPVAFERADMKDFELSWKLADYWGLVVLPPDRLSATAGELEHVKAAAGLEQAGRDMEAGIVYAKVLERWPTSLGALVGAGNVAYKRGDPRTAASFLRRAVRHHPDSASARHNLTVAEKADRMKARR